MPHENSLANLRPFKKGEGGKEKGNKQKKTIMYEKLLEKKIIESNAIFGAIDLYCERLDDKTITDAGLVNGWKAFVPFVARTKDNQDISEQLDKVLSKNEAEARVEKLQDKFAMIQEMMNKSKINK